MTARWLLVVLCLLPAVARAQPQSMPAPARRNGLALSGALGGGQVHNRYGTLGGWSRQLGVGAVYQDVVVRVDYFRVKGDVERSPHNVSHAFLGLMLESWVHNRLFIGGGAGFTGLSYDVRDTALAGSSAGSAAAQHLSVGGSFVAGGAPVWISNLAVTAQFRFLGSVHRNTLHTTGALLLGLALR
jgi:hypothetical protein